MSRGKTPKKAPNVLPLRPEQARFDVIVPIHNASHVVRLCLAALQRTAAPEKARVICVLDGCDAHTTALVADWVASRPNARIIQLEHNLGFVGACNAGLAETSAEFAVLVNSDTCATPGWTSLFEACFDSDPSIGIASPLSNFCPHNSVPMLPGLTYLQMAEQAATRQPRYPDITTCEGFFFAIRGTTLAMIGGFDGLFGAGYCEESDLSMRANYFGWRTVLVDNCYIFHFGRETYGAETRQMQYEKNKKIFFDRWGARYAADFARMQATDAIGGIRRDFEADARFTGVKWAGR